MKDKFTITIGIKSLEALHMFYDFRSKVYAHYKDGTDLQKQIYAESIETLKQLDNILSEIPNDKIIQMRKTFNNIFNEAVDSIKKE